mmetsp:Transcript_81891/g.162653  ORF Transcript_81891/g.162653 Transcript_81891/m.162653 type:complete len:105 (-) Transcript_81891:1470-1784(-)
MLTQKSAPPLVSKHGTPSRCDARNYLQNGVAGRAPSTLPDLGHAVAAKAREEENENQPFSLPYEVVKGQVQECGRDWHGKHLNENLFERRVWRETCYQQLFHPK